jgi:hypothetical protein
VGAGLLIEIKPVTEPREAKYFSEMFLDFANGWLGSLKLPNPGSDNFPDKQEFIN